MQIARVFSFMFLFFHCVSLHFNFGLIHSFFHSIFLLFLRYLILFLIYFITLSFVFHSHCHPFHFVSFNCAITFALFFFSLPIFLLIFLLTIFLKTETSRRSSRNNSYFLISWNRQTVIINCDTNEGFDQP